MKPQQHMHATLTGKNEGTVSFWTRDSLAYEFPQYRESLPWESTSQYHEGVYHESFPYRESASPIPFLDMAVMNRETAFKKPAPDATQVNPSTYFQKEVRVQGFDPAQVRRRFFQCR